MAVSKTQNERPAIKALIDAVNTAEPIVAQNVQNIATLTEELGDEISNREGADTALQSQIGNGFSSELTIAQSISATNNAVEAVDDKLGDEISNREGADTALQSQIGNGFSSELTIAQSISATNSAVEAVDDKIGDGIFSSSFTITQGFQQTGLALQNMSNEIDDINQWQDRFKLGLTQNVTVAAGSSTSGTLAFESPFGEDAEVAVFPVCVDASGNFTDLSCKLISADYSGFSFAVYNDTQASVTTKVGFLAAKVN